MLILFTLVGAFAVWTSLMMITQREPVHSALFLVLTFCALAVLYFALGAPLLGVLQVIVYAGAIMVLFLFVIMLLAAERREAQEEDPLPGVRRLGLVFAVLFAGIIGYVAWTSPARGEPGPLSMDQIIANNTQEVGTLLFSTYLMPFELTSILLLAAMVGAIVIAKRRLEDIPHPPLTPPSPAGGEGGELTRYASASDSPLPVAGEGPGVRGS